jgi:hypothetical protein
MTAMPGSDLRDDVYYPESDGKPMAETAARRLREELARLRGEGDPMSRAGDDADLQEVDDTDRYLLYAT